MGSAAVIVAAERDARQPWSAAIRGCRLAGRGQEVLRTLDGFADPAEQELEVFAALDEVELGGVDDQKITGGVVEEEMFVGLDDLFHVLVTDGAFVGGVLAAETLAQDIERSLKVDDEVRVGNSARRYL